MEPFVKAPPPTPASRYPIPLQSLNRLQFVDENAPQGAVLKELFNPYNSEVLALWEGLLTCPSAKDIFEAGRSKFEDITARNSDPAEIESEHAMGYLQSMILRLTGAMTPPLVEGAAYIDFNSENGAPRFRDEGGATFNNETMVFRRDPPLLALLVCIDETQTQAAALIPPEDRHHPSPNC